MENKKNRTTLLDCMNCNKSSVCKFYESHINEESQHGRFQCPYHNQRLHSCSFCERNDVCKYKEMEIETHTFGIHCEYFKKNLMLKFIDEVNDIFYEKTGRKVT